MLNYFKSIKVQEIFNMVNFVVYENIKHHMMDAVVTDFSSEVDSLYNEELTYCQDANIFIAKDANEEILGTIRVLKWNFIDPLPIQKIFGINPLDHINREELNDAYHFGRLAIQKDVPSLQLFKQLIATAIVPVCSHEHNVAFAECDSKLFRVLQLLGIEMMVIGDSIEYLGSETIPIMMTSGGLMNFYNQYWKSFADEVQIDPEKVLPFKIDKLL